MREFLFRAAFIAAASFNFPARRRATIRGGVHRYLGKTPSSQLQPNVRLAASRKAARSPLDRGSLLRYDSKRMRRSAPLIAISLAAFFVWPAHAEGPLQFATEQFFPFQSGGAVAIENTDGAIDIYSWREPRVRLAVLREAYTEPRLHQIEVATESRAQSLAIRTIVPPVHGLFADRSGTVEYTVAVPQTTRLNLSLNNGAITLHDLRGGTAQVALENGRVTASNCYARVQAHSRTGVLELFLPWWENLPAAFDYQISQGRIVVRLAGNARFRVDAQTRDGQIYNEFGLGAARRAGGGETLRRASAPAPPLSLRLRTGGGNIKIDKFR